MIPKFRAWDGKKMLPAIHIFINGMGVVWKNQRADHEDKDRLVSTKEFIIMQSTGLFDKNGIEIYEGDIVSDELRKKSYEVRWQDDFTGFYPFADSPDNCGHCGSGIDVLDCKVIGNCYQNPELQQTNLLTY